MQLVPNYTIGPPFPRTLGACREYCALIAGERNPAVKRLDIEIEQLGGDALLPSDVRAILYRLLISDEPL